MDEARSVLTLEKDRSLRELLGSILSARGNRVESFEDFAAARAALGDADFDAAVLDLDFAPDPNDHIQALRSCAAHVPIVLICSFAQVDRALEGIRVGAHDYFTKPFRREEVEIVIARSIRYRELERENERLESQAAAGALPVRVNGEGQLIDTRTGRPIGLRDLESLYIDKVLERVDGNKVRAARMLGINRRTLYRRGKGGSPPAKPNQRIGV